MMKPWEEDWCVSGLATDVLMHTGGRLCGELVGDSPERARLAAAAPAMARLLCEYEWVESRCMPCGASECYGVHATPKEEPGSAPWDKPRVIRRACPLDAALTAAGLDAEARALVREGR